ncbi:MAG: hypothetical protein RL138_792 [Bacteroidota bacterium]|jgi:hypothetical protein
MIVAIHQPNFIPWLGYFSKINQSDKFIILDTVDLQIGNANSITNRTRIKTQQGELWLTIPIKKSESKLIHSIQIDNKQPWQKKMLKSIQMAYSKAPHFNSIFPIFEELLQQPCELLSELNSKIIVAIATWLDIKTEVLIASKMPITSEDKNQRLIELIKQVDGDVYLSGNGARQYNDEGAYNSNGIQLTYTSYKPNEYPQLHGNFIPGLSILDAMMNLTKAEIQNMIK